MTDPSFPNNLSKEVHCTVYNADAPLMQPINLIPCTPMTPPSHRAVIQT